MAPGRNDPCPCGSGLKYKRCCLDAERRRERLASATAAAWGGERPELEGEERVKTLIVETPAGVLLSRSMSGSSSSSNTSGGAVGSPARTAE